DESLRHDLLRPAADDGRLPRAGHRSPTHPQDRRMILLPALALSPFAAALLLAFVPNERRRLAAWIAGGAALAGCALLASLGPALFDGAIPSWSIGWLPALDMRFGLRLDGLAWLFALLILGIGALVVLYAAYYL